MSARIAPPDPDWVAIFVILFGITKTTRAAEELILVTALGCLVLARSDEGLQCLRDNRKAVRCKRGSVCARCESSRPRTTGVPRDD
ncbi:hypothetical protein DF3PB_4620002 [uncultured Defluviicoccus sp.]|uniref:Uncharacterized protein n=1 Tax=metagenome TaxID=256318 RepID=A0A380TGY0_9ZZZZ|nr:hypothetical protein DF3PB_4620002 [uncultured Defluviicoccus sp.]